MRTETDVIVDGRTEHVVNNRYFSMSDYVRMLREGQRYWQYYGDLKTYYGGSVEQAIQRVADGASAKDQALAAGLLEKIDATLSGRHTREYIGTPAGAFPVVPEYLMGMPANMRRRAPMENDVAPVRIFVDCVVSNGLNDEMMAKRGAAIAALAIRLSETRAVELWAGSIAKLSSLRTTYIGMVRLENNPLSMAQVMAVVGSKSYARGIGYNAVRSQAKYVEPVSFAFDRIPSEEEYSRTVREAMNLEPQDIFIPGGSYSEAGAMLTDPVAWVEKYLAAQRHPEADE